MSDILDRLAPCTDSGTELSNADVRRVWAEITDLRASLTAARQRAEALVAREAIYRSALRECVKSIIATERDHIARKALTSDGTALAAAIEAVLAPMPQTFGDTGNQAAESWLERDRRIEALRRAWRPGEQP